MNFANCSRCGETIRWGEKDGGGMVALDPTPTRRGYVRLTSERGSDHAVILRGPRLMRARSNGEKLYMGHAQNCPAREVTE